MGVDLAAGAGFVLVGVVVFDGSRFEQGTVLLVRKVLSVLDLELVGLRLDDLQSRLCFDRILDHGAQLIIMEVVRPGDHGVVFPYLVLPME